MAEEHYINILGDFMNNLKLKIKGMDVHGTHPIVNGGWKVVRLMSKDEAATLVRAPAEILYKEHLWINHGYLVLELLDNYSADLVTPGMTAVYMCDGRYMTIRKL